MTINRRQFVQGATAAGALATVPSVAMGADTIKFGSILDTSGIFEAYGKPMEKAHILALEEINAAGGLLGRKVEMIPYDTQSNMALYTQYARRMTRRDKVDVVHGGILSASREAIRPSLRKAKTLYFYNTTYEGGVCDRNVFCVGTTPAQQSAILVPEAIKRWGKKIYVLAADYNYGQITTNWIKFYANKAGGEVIQADYFPLNVSDFGSTIAKIQKAKPDMICAVLVGLAHLSFYRQWAAAGMKKKIPIATTT
ncbi:MAG: ABC transporter substrate-binding protein, partial [Rhodospirillaceae bacterium]|nr:ABC transporter substrate-binding protein [Rhodospirillaceae bacterium]